MTSYIVRYGTTSGAYSSATNVGNQTSANVGGLQAGQTYYLAVTARTATGIESPPSNEATYQTPGMMPPVVTLTTPLPGASYQSPATIPCAANVTANGRTITKVQFLNGATLLGEVATAPYNFSWNGVAAGTYSMTARAVYDSNNTVTSAAATVGVTNPPPVNGLTFEATSGVITAPFKINGSTISQSVLTTLAASGRAVYTFNIVAPGDYTVAAKVSAADGSQNSFFVNIDAEPTDPGMIWHIVAPVGLQTRTVSWQGSGTADSPQFVPKIFPLAAGTHQLIFRGRETNALLGAITISPVAVINPPPAVIAPTISLTAPPTDANFVSPATVNLAASVTANGHTITKVQFFNSSALLGESTSSPYSFAWSSVGAGTYTLKARVVYDSGSTLDSAASSITVAAPALPAPWQTADLGAIGLSGTAGHTNGVYTVRGAGQLSGTADSFRFVYQTLSADGEITAQLTSVQTNHVNNRFGVMIRESLAVNSKYAFMGLSPDLKFRWQRRSSSGGNTSSTVATVSTLPNTWIRLVRTGNTLTGYKSPNGTNWTKVASSSITMAANVSVGYVVASGTTNALSSATFANGFVVP